MAKKASTYQVLVYIAYAFYLLFGIAWFVANLMDHGINYMALFLIAIFAVQCFYRNKLVNLIIGIMSLGGSIFMLLETLSTFNLFAPHAVFDGFVKAIIALSFVSILFSGILIFSYMKLNFQEE